MSATSSKSRWTKPAALICSLIASLSAWFTLQPSVATAKVAFAVCVSVMVFILYNNISLPGYVWPDYSVFCGFWRLPLRSFSTGSCLLWKRWNGQGRLHRSLKQGFLYQGQGEPDVAEAE